MDRQSGGDGGYESYEDMIKDIHQKTIDPDRNVREEAKIFENQLWKNTIRALKIQHEKGIPDHEIKGRLADTINEGDTKLQNGKRRLF